MKRIVCLGLLFILAFSLCGCETNTTYQQGFPESEIVDYFGMSKAKLYNKLDLDSTKDLNDDFTWITANGSGIMLKKTSTYFGHAFQMVYQFSHVWGLSRVEYRTWIVDCQESLGMLKSIADWFTQRYETLDQYKTSTIYDVAPANSIDNYFKKSDAAKDEVFSLLPVELEQRWLVKESMPESPERSLVAEVRYRYVMDDETYQRKAWVTVAFFTCRLNEIRKVRDAFPEAEILEDMGATYNGFVEKHQLLPQRDIDSGSVSQTQYGMEFMLKVPRIYFGMEFKPKYTFDYKRGLMQVSYSGTVANQQQGLTVLQDIGEYYNSRYDDATLPASSTESYQLTEFLEKGQAEQLQILGGSQAASLKGHWMICEFAPDNPDLRLDVLVSYDTVYNAAANTSSANITVTYQLNGKAMLNDARERRQADMNGGMLGSAGG